MGRGAVGGKVRDTRRTGVDLDEALKALASEHRRAIVRMIGECTPAAGKTCCRSTELCGCKLVDRLGLAQSTVSHHMSILVRAGLVGARREGQWVYYTLRRDALREVADALRDI